MTGCAFSASSRRPEPIGLFIASAIGLWFLGRRRRAAG
jgi:hypothetical protein